MRFWYWIRGELHYSALVRCGYATLRPLFASCLAGSIFAMSNPGHGQCPGDLSGNGVVNGTDLGFMLSVWGETGSEFSADLNVDGVVDGGDLGILLVAWGDCPVLPAPPWATMLEALPNPAVVTDQQLRDSIASLKVAWRIRDNLTQSELVLIPPGTYLMGCSASSGSACNSNEWSIHEVTITSPFYLGRREITQGEWIARMGSNPSYFVGFSDSVNRPVERVTWTAVQGFLAQTTMRLPTEAEWEYVCRAGSDTAYPGYPSDPLGFNDDERLGAIAWFAGNNGAQTSAQYGTKAVGQLAPNGLGAFDLCGNVSEWVSDCLTSSYASASVVDPVNSCTGNNNRAVRGGGWASPAGACRTSQRGQLNKDQGNFGTGFRVVRNLVTIPAWADLLEPYPDPLVVTNLAHRTAIIATGYPWRVRHKATGIEMVLVPSGSFPMGCSASALGTCATNESPVHNVNLTSALYIGRYEVTQAQWQARMSTNPSYFQGDQYPDWPQRPVERVSWDSIQPFLTQTGLRLLSEAEWEYAYRAGTTTAFHGSASQPAGTSDDALLNGLAWCAANNGQFGSAQYGTKVVGQRLANGFGLHDMSGNVWEWVSDWHSGNYYSSSPQNNPSGPSSGTYKVVRGGNWEMPSAFCRASYRSYFVAPVHTGNGVGFRVARNP